MVKRLSNVLTMIVSFSLFYATSAFTQESFYQGKVIRIIVATAAGGGSDQ